MNFWLVSFSLLEREVVRFLRDRSRIVGAFATPLVFWFLIGSGLGRSFRAPGSSLFSVEPSMNYLQYFFPGTIIMILLFTAIFSTISVIEDRNEGFLQGVLVAPVPRSTIVMGKLLGGTVLAFGQGFLFLLATPFLNIHMSFVEFIYVVAVMLFASFGLTGLGFIIAWRMESTQGFHAIMNLFLVPLWFLSGALFPPDGAPAWLRFIMKVNPLSYGVFGLHRGFFRGLSSDLPHMPTAAVCLGVTALFALAMFAVSSAIVGKTPRS